MRDALDSLVADLRGIFGDRLSSVVVYQAGSSTESARTPDPVHTLALVDRVRFPDIVACAARNAAWGRQGLATPLVMGKNEFARSLDAFPLEYGQIIATRRVVAGSDAFEGLSVKAEDLRRACEVQAKSHLVHLREAYIEGAGRPASIARLIVASVAPFRALLVSVARLRGNPSDGTAALVREAEAMGLRAPIVERVLGLAHPRDLRSGDVAQVFQTYLEAAEQLAKHIDEW